MNLKNLSKIDFNELKNIDWETVKEYLLSRPGLIINVSIIAATAVVTLTYCRSQLQSVKALNDEITVLQEKAGVISALDKTQKEYDQFVKQIPQTISADMLIEILSEIALERDVQIVSFSPANEKNSTFASLTNVKITIKSEKYANTIRFIHDIENSPYSIRIGDWRGALSSQDALSRGNWKAAQSDADDSNEKNYTTVTIEIQSVEFKDV